MTNHTWHEYEKDKSFEAFAQVQFTFCFLEEWALWFENFENSNQPRQLYQLVHSADSCDSDYAVHTRARPLVISWSLVFRIVTSGNDFLNIANRKDGEQIDEKPSTYVIDRNDTSILDHLKVLIIVRSIKNQDHVHEEYQIHCPIDDFPLKIVFFREC